MNSSFIVIDKSDKNIPGRKYLRANSQRSGSNQKSSASLRGYHSIFALNPQYGYGVIVLVTGDYSQTSALLRTVTQAYQPAFEALQRQLVSATYAGTWSDGNGSLAKIKVVHGELHLEKLVVEGVNVIQRLVPGLEPVIPKRLTLWATGKEGEFRCVYSIF